MLFYAEHPPSRLAIEVGLDRCHDLASRILSSFPDGGGEAARADGSQPLGGYGPARAAAPSMTSGGGADRTAATSPGVSPGGGERQPAPGRTPPTGRPSWPYLAVVMAEGLTPGC